MRPAVWQEAGPPSAFAKATAGREAGKLPFDLAPACVRRLTDYGGQAGQACGSEGQALR